MTETGRSEISEAEISEVALALPKTLPVKGCSASSSGALPVAAR